MRQYKKCKGSGTVGYIDIKKDNMWHVNGFSIGLYKKEDYTDATNEEIEQFKYEEHKWEKQQKEEHEKEATLLDLCALKHCDFVRFRHVFKEGGKLVVETRENGVGARSLGAIKNKNYRASWSDDCDSTYEYYSFSIPEVPPIPSKWKSRKYGTRHVIDRTGGGDVVYIQGRLPVSPWKEMYQRTCTLAEWVDYQKTAKVV